MYLYACAYMYFHLFFYFDYFLSVACYEVFIQRCLRITLCFPISNYFFLIAPSTDVIVSVTLRLTLNRIHYRLVLTLLVALRVAFKGSVLPEN